MWKWKFQTFQQYIWLPNRYFFLRAAVLLKVQDQKAPILGMTLKSAHFWVLLLNSDFEKRPKKLLKSAHLVLVMHRVWDSRGRVGSGFGQSGLGLGRVFAYFESRVRVLASRVSGFCRVSNFTMK